MTARKFFYLQNLSVADPSTMKCISPLLSLGVLCVTLVMLSCTKGSNEGPIDIIDSDTDSTVLLEDQPSFNDTDVEADTGSVLDSGALIEDADVPPVTLPGARAMCAGSESLPSWLTPGDSGDYVAECGALKLFITPFSEGVFRLRYQGDKPVAMPNHSYALVDGIDSDSPHRIIVTEQGFRICTESLALHVAEENCAITLQDASSDVLVQDAEEGGYFEGPGYLNGPLPWSVGIRRRIESNDHFYGFGEKNGDLDKRGALMHFWNSDVPGYQPTTDPLYQSMLNFVGLRGNTAYGVFTDNTFRSHADMGNTDAEHYTLLAEGGQIDQYLIAGPLFSDVLRRYTRLTGRLQMPPLWSLGYHQCRHGYFPDTLVQDIASQLRSRSIPADGIWLDIDYMDAFRVWTWSPTDFSDPIGFVSNLAEQGFHTTVIIDPGVKVDDDWPVYTSGLEQSFYLNTPEGTPFIGEVWPGPSVYPDFTNPGAREWWANFVPTMTDIGVEGLWLDMNEPANFDSNYNWTVPNWVEADGEGTPTTMAEVHNVYALAMAEASYEGMLLAKPDTRPFLLTRAGYSGVQRYAATWTGDIPSTWAALESTLPMMLNMGLSGNAFVGSDVGGWQGGQDMGPELLARWMQLGAVSPFYRNHTQKNAENQEPWTMGLETEDISRNVVSERYRMLPYWYALFEESSRTGAPILRPLVYEFQEDTSVRNLGNQAMIGSHLMVAPVQSAGATEQSVYFPEGRWYEYRSGAIYEGPSTATIDLRLGALPLFAREGAIIPRTVDMQYTGQKPWAPIYFDIFPGSDESSFTLYEDDGATMAYQNQLYARTPITVTPSDTGLSLTVGERSGEFQPPSRSLEFVIHRVEQEPSSITWQGEPVELSTTSNLEEDGPHAKYDPFQRELTLRVADGIPGTFTCQYDSSVGDSAPPILKHFQVETPLGTLQSETIHIALSSNDWQHQALTWSSSVPGLAEGWVEVPRGAWFDYKYSRGDWSTVEQYANCSDTENRYAFGGTPLLKKDVVQNWTDTCQ